MSPKPSIDYTCPHCGAKTTYELVPTQRTEPGSGDRLRPIPSIDFSCARCGVSQTYTLSPGTSA